MPLKCQVKRRVIVSAGVTDHDYQGETELLFRSGGRGDVSSYEDQHPADAPVGVVLCSPSSQVSKY